MTTKTAIIHSVSASNDVLTDIGWDYVDMYVAVQYSENNDGDVIGGDISWRALKDRLAAEGWTVIDEDDVFVFDSHSSMWVRKG